MPASSGATSSSSPAPTRCARATPATCRPRRSARRSAGRARRSRRATPRARRARPRWPPRERRSSPGSAMSPWSSAPTPSPKGFFAPNDGDRPDDPDWLRFRLLGATNPTYFALYARRRMDVYGATERDFAKVKVKNAQHGLNNPNARYRKAVTEDDVLASPIVASPLHLLDICATSDGGAALVVSSMEYARTHGNNVAGAGARHLHGHAPLPQHGDRDARLRHRLVGRAGAADAHVPRLDRRRGLRAGRPRPRRHVRRRGVRPLVRPSSSTGTRTSASARPARPSG